MAYQIQMNLPEGWKVKTEVSEDEYGAQINHLEAHLYVEGNDRDSGMIDIYVGDTPEDTTAEDQALSNYADIVGFDEDDPEDFNPIAKVLFNGRAAYVFEALCEDDSPMMFLSTEIRKGVLVIICAAAPDDEKLQEVMTLVERNLRVR